MKWLVSLLLLFHAICCVAHSETKTEDMLSACRWIESANMEEGKVSVPPTFESGKCWGAFSVLQTMLNIVDTRDGDKNKFMYFSVCAPLDSTNTQLMAIFVAYAKKHPERWHQEFFFVARDALAEAFPCQKSK